MCRWLAYTGSPVFLDEIILKPRSLFHSMEMRALRELSPNIEDLSDETRAVVSEPFGQLSEAWVEIPSSTAVVIEGGCLEKRPFLPRA